MRINIDEQNKSITITNPFPEDVPGLIKICASLPQLQKLDISLCTELRDDDVKGIIAATNHLTHLDLSENKMTRVSLLPNLGNLTSLSLAKCYNLSTVELDSNLNLVFLAKLDLSESKSLEVVKIIELVKRSPNLANLSLASFQLDSKQLENILDSTAKLEILNISKNHNLTTLKLSANLSEMETLDLSSCDNLSSLVFDPSTLLFPRLHHLNLHKLKKLPAEQIIALVGKASNLSVLNIGSCKLDSQQITSIVDMTPNLRELNASSLHQITNLEIRQNTVEKIDLKECSKLQKLTLDASALRELDLSRCLNIEEIEARNITSLAKINLSNCRKLQPNQIINLIASCPNLEEINITGINQAELIINQIRQINNHPRRLKIKNGDVEINLDPIERRPLNEVTLATGSPSNSSQRTT